MRGQWVRCRATAQWLAIYVAAYVAALVIGGIAVPRREIGQGERKCFDDWCVAATGVEHKATSEMCPGAASVWVAAVHVTSVARRVRQRAADASVEMEDDFGDGHAPCAAASGHNIRDALDPGESFTLMLPFALPAPAHPAGLVVAHGRFPGLIIVGDDQGWLHKPSLFRLTVY
ncbi:MAG TPA: hypothetical protein VGL53_21785 [Bryobacteraceae bacterium]